MLFAIGYAILLAGYILNTTTCNQVNRYQQANDLREKEFHTKESAENKIAFKIHHGMGNLRGGSVRRSTGEKGLSTLQYSGFNNFQMFYDSILKNFHSASYTYLGQMDDGGNDGIGFWKNDDAFMKTDIGKKRNQKNNTTAPLMTATEEENEKRAQLKINNPEVIEKSAKETDRIKDVVWKKLEIQPDGEIRWHTKGKLDQMNAKSERTPVIHHKDTKNVREAKRIWEECKERMYKRGRSLEITDGMSGNKEDLTKKGEDYSDRDPKMLTGMHRDGKNKKDSESFETGRRPDINNDEILKSYEGSWMIWKRNANESMKRKRERIQ